jgi:predicted adenine nucleotide alpha hydrolase (AANH) superfamily ATPase
LSEDKREFAVLFYNPNISPLSEYAKRLEGNKRVCQKFQVPFIELPHEPEVWELAVRGYESAPERGERCYKCFLLRLTKAANYAKENGFASFSSVLGVSRYKDLKQVNAAAKQAENDCGVAYDFTNWRKGGLEELRGVLIDELGLYNQTFCGCKYSLRRRREVIFRP